MHGGAWSIPDDKVTSSRAGCLVAARKGMAVLLEGGTAVDAVEAAVRSLEDDPVFDAGKGSCLTKDGAVECDAMIQRGDTLDAGAVACVSSTRNSNSRWRALCWRNPTMCFWWEKEPMRLVGGKAWSRNRRTTL